MIRVTLTPNGVIAKRLLFKCLHFLWVFSIFILQVGFALIRFVLGLQERKQAVSSETKLQTSVDKKQALKAVSQQPQQQASERTNFEPTSFIISIAPNDVYSREKIKILINRGYKWHSGLNAWALPRVRLGDNHPDFERVIAELKLAGYIWRGMYWILYFPKTNNVFPINK